ncbi:MAG: response regulator [Planctomycetes bacterium]|nr:response regulator [Planctomycetota bacterium]
MRKALAEKGHDVRTAMSVDEAVQQMEDGRVELGLIDFHMPGASGVEVLQEIRARANPALERALLHLHHGQQGAGRLPQAHLPRCDPAQGRHERPARSARARAAPDGAHAPHEALSGARKSASW